MKSQPDVSLSVKLKRIVKPLLKWYDANARILPWRNDTSPYRVLVSEIMLQQTRVDTVIPYFERFMQTLPTMNDLANAPEELLLKLWEGLGYYNRVRNLQKAALLIIDHHHGTFPDNTRSLLALPGIGEYTAGAIASICFNQPEPAVDGNVMRVLSRLLEDTRDISSNSYKKEATETLRAIYPSTRCGDFTQSLMELGALVCLPNGAPRCTECPLSHLCLAKENGTQSCLPVKKKRTQRQIEKHCIFLLRHNGKLAVHKRPGSGLLAKLWEFPNIPGVAVNNKIKQLLSKWGVSYNDIRPAGQAIHIFSHVQWDMTVYHVNCNNESPLFLWEPENNFSVSLPTAFRKLLKLTFTI